MATPVLCRFHLISAHQRTALPEEQELAETDLAISEEVA
jgi:hypothetical protein